MKWLQLQVHRLYRRNLRQQKEQTHQLPQNQRRPRQEEWRCAVVVDLWEEQEPRHRISSMLASSARDRVRRNRPPPLNLKLRQARSIVLLHQQSLKKRLSRRNLRAGGSEEALEEKLQRNRRQQQPTNHRRLRQ